MCRSRCFKFRATFTSVAFYSIRSAIIARALQVNFRELQADLEWRVNPIDADNKALLPGSHQIQKRTHLKRRTAQNAIITSVRAVRARSRASDDFSRIACNEVKTDP